MGHENYDEYLQEMATNPRPGNKKKGLILAEPRNLVVLFHGGKT